MFQLGGTNFAVSEFLMNQLLTFCCWAFCIVAICCATTDSTSTSIRLNSSKHAHAPELQNGRQTKHMMEDL